MLFRSVICLCYLYIGGVFRPFDRWGFPTVAGGIFRPLISIDSGRWGFPNVRPVHVVVEPFDGVSRRAREATRVWVEASLLNPLKIVVPQAGPDRGGQSLAVANVPVVLDVLVRKGDELSAVAPLGLEADGESDDRADHLHDGQR